MVLGVILPLSISQNFLFWVFCVAYIRSHFVPKLKIHAAVWKKLVTSLSSGCTTGMGATKMLAGINDLKLVMDNTRLKFSHLFHEHLLWHGNVLGCRSYTIKLNSFKQWHWRLISICNSEQYKCLLDTICDNQNISVPPRDYKSQYYIVLCKRSTNGQFCQNLIEGNFTR